MVSAVLLSFFIFTDIPVCIFPDSPQVEERLPSGGEPVILLIWVKDHPLYAALLLFSVFVNYRLGIRLGRRRKSGCRKGWLVAGIFTTSSWLVLFKYAGFISENINLLLAETGAPSGCQVPPLFCPLESASTHSRPFPT